MEAKLAPDINSIKHLLFCFNVTNFFIPKHVHGLYNYNSKLDVLNNDLVTMGHNQIN